MHQSYFKTNSKSHSSALMNESLENPSDITILSAVYSDHLFSIAILLYCLSPLKEWRPIETRKTFGIHVAHVLTQLGACLVR